MNRPQQIIPHLTPDNHTGVYTKDTPASNESAHFVIKSKQAPETTELLTSQNPVSMSMMDSVTEISINIDANDYNGEDTFGRDSNAIVDTHICMSGTWPPGHMEARLLREVVCHSVSGVVTYKEPQWIDTQSIGDDWWYWEGPEDWNPQFTQALTLANLCTTGTWYGGNPPQQWEGWDITVVYRIEIKSAQDELYAVTDGHGASYPDFGSWAIGHGEIQRLVTSAAYGGLSGLGRIDYGSNIVGSQDWNWAYMDGYYEYDTSYFVNTMQSIGLDEGFGFARGDLYIFSYTWSGFPSNVWLWIDDDSSGNVYMSGTTPQWSNGGCFWSGQPYWTNQQWVRFCATFQSDYNGLAIFQQTPSGRYGANFSIDSIVQTPTFSEPEHFQSYW